MLPLSLEDIRRTARATFAALNSASLDGCLVGSAACSEHGATRMPNDVDILVLTDHKIIEEIQAAIMLADPHFSLSRLDNDPTAPSTVLWYTLSAPREPIRACRVDIFVPGSIQLPLVPLDRIICSSVTNFPVMPLIAVLLHKAIAWVARGRLSGPHARSKQASDIADTKDLLAVARERNLTITHADWLPFWFLHDATQAVELLCEAYPDTRPDWIRTGFQITD
ncbi:hypothetical protein BDN72DRAFT_753881 [Pluteus cervinus]|uniref:Uncharacterized protein n=1 Tax=Pluteus cervinus TaxID=181527 RepID=A0ACD3BI62_9AGAR|nr:hypothetical protein BDN72DRAFT_753881 [Pluteus cervinus]